MKSNSQKKYPKVSVVLPFYNRVKETLAAISSIKSQTYKNIELIVINDGSSDPSIHLIELALSEIPNSIYINNKINSGPAFARNLGIDKSSGKYISFLDSDDIWYPRKLDIQINLMLVNNWLFSHTSYHQFNHDDDNKKIIHSGKVSYKFPFIIFSCRIATPTVIIKRKILLKYKFNPKLRVGEDHILWSSIAKQITLHGIDQPLSQVNINSSSTFQNYLNLHNAQKSLRNELLRDNEFLFIFHYLYNLFKFYFFSIKKIIQVRETIKPNLIIYANNISNGGGLTILIKILRSIKDKKTIVYLDNRINRNFLKNFGIELNLKYVKANIFSRFLSEISLFLNSSDKSTVLCLGNLPPIFRLKSKVFLLIHNRLILKLPLFSLTERHIYFRLVIERFWLYFFSKNVDYFIVQTKIMKKILGAFLPNRDKVIYSMPIFSNFYFKDIENKIIKYDFIYVSSGEKHKNHKNLIDAWILLAEENCFPSLCLTLSKDTYASLCSYINDMKAKYKLKIFNEGEVSLKNIQLLYSKSSALIFPSLSESFGLPLLEARYLGMPIIASELDYVRAVSNPIQTFDPRSPYSISHAVRRYLGFATEIQENLTPEDFVSILANQKSFN